MAETEKLGIENLRPNIKFAVNFFGKLLDVKRKKGFWRKLAVFGAIRGISKFVDQMPEAAREMRDLDDEEAAVVSEDIISALPIENKNTLKLLDVISRWLLATRRAFDEIQALLKKEDAG